LEDINPGRDKVKEELTIQMVLGMREIGKMIRNMAKGHLAI